MMRALPACPGMWLISIHPPQGHGDGLMDQHACLQRGEGAAVRLMAWGWGCHVAARPGRDRWAVLLAVEVSRGLQFCHADPSSATPPPPRLLQMHTTDASHMSHCMHSPWRGATTEMHSHHTQKTCLPAGPFCASIPPTVCTPSQPTESSAKQEGGDLPAGGILT